MMLAQGSSTIFSPSNVKLFLYGSVVLVMIASRIVKAAKEAAERKRLSDASKRAELEALRTGRPVVDVTANVGTPELSAAERLEQLARQREQTARTPGARPSTSPTKSQGSTTGRPPNRPQRQPQIQEPRIQPVRKLSAPAPQQGKSSHTPLATTVDTAPSESTTHRLVPDAATGTTPSARPDSERHLTSRVDLRKAIILREIVDPPLSLRD